MRDAYLQAALKCVQAQTVSAIEAARTLALRFLELLDNQAHPKPMTRK
jgi:hypothetical protein